MNPTDVAEIPLDDKTKEAIQTRLTAWYRRKQRILPWRDNPDPYAVLVSEVMLQQTQVATVIPFFERFMVRFPTVQTLADAAMEDVLKEWEGLGYYSRARNLQQAAREVIARYDGRIPDELEALRSLPGVGRYTAGAIASIAFNKPVPLLDGNVMRVLTRLFCIEGDPRIGRANRRLWRLAEGLVPSENAREFNTGLMELGALLCAPVQPQCDACPLSNLCLANLRREVLRYPDTVRRVETTRVEDIAVLVEREGRLLLTQRPPDALWAGLWELPRVRREGGETLEEAAERAALRVCGVVIRIREKFAMIRHTVTRYRIRLHAYRAEWVSGEARPLECAAVAWITPEELPRYPLSTPQRRLLARAFHEEAQGRLF